ncbi:hypothetical protein ACIRN4_12460 [Pimelobacter simplex]|uniref:hypothetical protein n=1 Tax=Nocardioides simplex TaxID=2045 RepID=UPI00382BCCBD
MKTRDSSRRTFRKLAVMATALAAMAVGFGTAPAHAAEVTNDFDANGTTHVGGSVDASMPIGPTILTVDFDLTTRDISDGLMPIPAQVMNFDIMGIPARSTVTMTQKTPLSGTLTPSGIRAKYIMDSTVSYDIRLSNVEVKVFGIWWPLAVGSNCHTIDPVVINAKSPAGEYFMLTQGGPAEATYTIGNFTGCAPLNFFDIPGFFPWFGSIPINAIVPNSDNTLSLNLTNPRLHQ